MTTAIDRLHAAAHRPGTAHLRDLAIGIGPISLADALEILATVERLHTRLAAVCDEHATCEHTDCGAVFCDGCGIGDPGYCAHGFPRCRDHWPATSCTDCMETAAEETAYAKNDRPWGAPA